MLADALPPPTAALPAVAATQTNWAGVSSYYLYSCNATVRAEALNAVRAAGLKVVRVFLLSTSNNTAGAVAACEASGVPDVEPAQVGVYDDTILARLDDLLLEAAARGLKLTVALHDRWSLGCWRADAYQRKYNLTRADCRKNPAANDPARFYTEGRADFERRIHHILTYTSRHTGEALGQWHDAIFSLEAENEAFGDAEMDATNADWVCRMSTVIRAHAHPSILVSSGGGGIGLAEGAAEYARAKSLAECPAIDVVGLHSYRAPGDVAKQLSGYAAAIQPARKRLILQEWGVAGPNSTAKAEAFRDTAAVAAAQRVPQMYWALQPAHAPVPSSQHGVSPPSPGYSPGPQRQRAGDGRWINRCDAVSCPTEVWVTALYPAAQAAALQLSAADWPELWGCAGAADCSFNGECLRGTCLCRQGWRGPTCAALNLGPAPRNNGFQHRNASSWGGSIVRDEQGVYHMFSSFITEGCGLDAWSTNSEIVRATAHTPTGPYTMQEVVAERFAHEPNLIFGTGPDSVVLLGTMDPEPPTRYTNCTHGQTHMTPPAPPLHPARNTYLWSAATPEGLVNSTRQLAISAPKWNTDPLHNGAVCDTNAAAAMGLSGNIVGLWRHCETSTLHTVPHTFTAVNATIASAYRPNVSVNVPFLSHAGAEDPMVWTYPGQLSGRGQWPVYHALLHDEQLTRCADGPVGCWPGGRHAFSVDNGATWEYSSLDAYNGTVTYTDGAVEDYYLRARPHLLLSSEGRLVALSNGLRPTKASDYVFTLVQPVL